MAMIRGGLRSEITAMLVGAHRGLTAAEVRDYLVAGRNVNATLMDVGRTLMDLHREGSVVVQYHEGDPRFVLRKRITAA